MLQPSIPNPLSKTTPTATPSPALARLKLLDALRAGDATRAALLVTDHPSLAPDILHLAVQVAPLGTIQALVPSLEPDATNGSDLVNKRDLDGNTPLHLAVLADRRDLVAYLLSLLAINDTLVNNAGLQAVELARDMELAQLMQVERAKFVERAAGRLRAALTAQDYDTLDALFASQRVVDLLDINGTDPETGDTVLHEFVRANNVKMCRWILAHGGDPFKRDRQGRLPSALAKGHPTLVALLSEAAGDQSVLGATSSAIDPTFKGYLRKWTNFALGYKLRYFTLDQNGILSYYSDQNDTANACRGSLNLGHAALHLDSSEKLKFEIISANGEVKWHLKANHPVESNRWVWALQGGIRVAKDLQRGATKTHAPLHTMAAAVGATPLKRQVAPSLLPVGEPHHHAVTDGESDSEAEEDRLDELVGPHGEAASIARRTLEIELRSVSEVLRADTSHDESRVLAASITTIQELFGRYAGLMETRDAKLIKALDRQREINQLWERSIHELEAEVGDRERLLVDLDAQRKTLKQALRENEGAGPVVPEPAGPLGSTEATQHRPNAESSASGTPTKKATLKGPPESDELRTALTQTEFVKPPIIKTTSTYSAQVQQLMDEDSDDEFYDADDYDAEAESTVITGSHAPPGYIFTDLSNIIAGQTPVVQPSAPAAAPSQEEPPSVDPVQALSHSPVDKSSVPSAIQPATTHTKKPADTDKMHSATKSSGTRDLAAEGSFAGYTQPPRKRLALDADNRPKISLWGILKSMIGKDLLKISLPVSFNECTSLLQRVAEDMEYTSLLDTAASFDDSTLRMVYVAAFAASEYASTLNRVAKPFNPLLGETYELALPDGNFRFLTEQVSHHPPISAALAESPLWDYYGESAVKSKFNGRSFDVLPQGTWYLNLRSTDRQGATVEELYTWKKITSSVTGIISGSPSIDNYGEMEIRNHTTGDVVVLDFKQRGWRVAGACEVKGTITDKNGKPRWVIGGHWNDRIYAKKASEDSVGAAHKTIASGSNAKATPNPDSKFLVWTVNTRPKSPFNLTGFSITLNELRSDLKEWLPVTDTRLRPDQRAMEDGRYEEAATEKLRVEEKQRGTRKRLELANKEHHPRWFEEQVHPVTQEKYWRTTGDYWKQRQARTFEVEEIF